MNRSITNKPRLTKKVKGAAAFCNETNTKNNCFFVVTSCYKKDRKSKRAVCKNQPCRTFP
ncbi:hypothetical protein CW755_05845 [Geobacillus thermodenitrificans]|nr:hypothetical protein [Geobacillus thermodenitrificans]NNU87911.1 hypothetical protein [Geobacillus sp. MR]OQP08536.1 hypothetical protein B1691_14850 [Geobacillus sp. 47C-IIb]PJW20183.1 hypothetical protein CV632_12650 [Geobacillus thermodenitrificans]PTR47901.1 hypothetical protein CW755_05845 [Geobacillus thermodenitrificans]